MAYTLPLTQWIRLEDCLRDKGVSYFFKPSRNDGFMFQTGNGDGLTKYHIHSIEEAGEDDMIFTKLLAKSSNWRGGNEPDLATFPIDRWAAQCVGMDASVLMVVRALGECFTALGAAGP
ncbi:MAG TPA: hypothetical protein VIM98_07015 [Dyella sp.]|uniref:hypothetical protein n=1 Tax=Dyella sp. TaxID=1869338 RepID=UPI002F93B944